MSSINCLQKLYLFTTSSTGQSLVKCNASSTENGRKDTIWKGYLVKGCRSPAVKFVIRQILCGLLIFWWYRCLHPCKASAAFSPTSAETIFIRVPMRFEINASYSSRRLKFDPTDMMQRTPWRWQASTDDRTAASTVSTWMFIGCFSCIRVCESCVLHMMASSEEGIEPNVDPTLNQRLFDPCLSKNVASNVVRRMRCSNTSRPFVTNTKMKCLREIKWNGTTKAGMEDHISNQSLLKCQQNFVNIRTISTSHMTNITHNCIRHAMTTICFNLIFGHVCTIFFISV